jgi:DNA-binding CsgD family transcriptional regulator/tetratricopeptide (TPR) repeat protein
MELLERDRVLAELGDELAAAVDGAGRLVFLAGDAGIGKTAVVTALAARPGRPVRLLWGACDALSTPRTLGPVHDMAAVTPRLAALLADEPARHTLLTGVLEELARTPTLVIVEDAHWADEATLDLLRFVGRRVHRTPTLVIATYRDDEVAGDHPLRPVLGELATTPGHVRMRLEPLSAAAVRTLAEGRSVDPDQLHRITGGNAFYVTEVLAATQARVPTTVADAVLARAARLSDGAREVLSTAAVEPGPVEPWLLDGLGHPRAAIEEATGSGMLVHDGNTVRFRHELARLATDDSLPGAQRVELHRRVLAVLERRRGVEPARVAHHAQAAGDAAATLRWAREAAQVAASRGAHRQAAEQYERALQHADGLEPGELADLLEAYGAELAILDRNDDNLEVRRRVVDLRRQLDDPVALAMSRLRLSNPVWRRGDPKGSWQLVTDVIATLEALPPGAVLAQAYAEAAMLAMLDLRGTEALEWSARAIDLAERTDADEPLIRALNASSCTRIGSFEDLGGIDDLERGARIAADNGWDLLYAHAISNPASTLVDIRRYDEAIRYGTKGLTYSLERDLDTVRDHNIAWLARSHLEQGRWDEAATLLASVAWDEHRLLNTRTHGLATLGRLRVRRGDPGAAGPLEEAWRLARLQGELKRLWPAIVPRAEHAWLTGEGRDDAAQDVLELLATCEDREVAWAPGELAFWAAKLGRPLDHLPDGTPEPFALHLTGDHLAAAEAWAQIGCPYEQAWALADAGDETSLRAALEILMDLGAAPFAERVRQRLRALGVTHVPAGPRPATRANPAGLTGRQLEVLGLLAEGLSDAEVAERLHISRKTAGHHVGAILRKLGVSNRTEAATVGLREGWVDEPAATP